MTPTCVLLYLRMISVYSYFGYKRSLVGYKRLTAVNLSRLKRESLALACTCSRPLFSPAARESEPAGTENSEVCFFISLRYIIHENHTS